MRIDLRQHAVLGFGQLDADLFHLEIKVLQSRENRQFLPGHHLPESIQLAHEPASSFDDPAVIISAVPCQYTRGVWQRFADCVPRDIPIVSVTKGIENDTLMLPTAIIHDCLGAEVPTACLSGPSIAPEVASCCNKGLL